jgi:hypothetical protein
MIQAAIKFAGSLMQTSRTLFNISSQLCLRENYLRKKNFVIMFFAIRSFDGEIITPE